MNNSLLYKNVILFGNKEIAYLVTRSLSVDEKKLEISVDDFRLKNELLLYRYNKNKGNGSIISALIPIIAANPSAEKSEFYACKVFEKIRKKISIQNKIGINLLCYLAYHLDELDESFSSFTMLNASKEQQVAFQKEKIEIILGKKTLVESILSNLEETDWTINQNLLDQMIKNENLILEDPKDMSMDQFFMKINRFMVKIPPLKEAFSLNNFLKTLPGNEGYDPLVGKFTVEERKDDSLLIQSKRGELELVIP